MSHTTRPRTRRRVQSAKRHAAFRRFFAQVEPLEPRQMLATADPLGSSSDKIMERMTAWQAASDWIGSFEGQTGDLEVAATSRSTSEYGGYLPGYSTRELRPGLAAAKVTVPAAITWSTLEVETTFNTVTGSTLYFNTSGLSSLDEIQVTDLLDVAGLPAGRYPFHMDFVGNRVGGGTDVFDYDGHVLVAGPSDSLISPGWRIAGLDRLSFDGDGALWETAGGDLYWFNETGGNYTSPTGELSGAFLDEDGGVYTITDRFGNASVFNALGLLTEKLDRFGNSTTFVYDDKGPGVVLDDLVEIASFDGTSMTFGYDSSSPYRLETITDFDGRTVTLDYDAGMLDTLTFPDPGASGDPLVIQYQYNGDDLLDTVTEGLGAGALEYVTTFGYAPLTWALQTLIHPDGTEENYKAALSQTIGSLSTPATVVKATDVAVTKTTVDGNGTSDLTTAYYLGAFGRVKKIVDPLGNITSFTLDGSGRVTKRTDPDPDSIGSGLPAPETDSGFDGDNNLISMELPDGTDLTWEDYDPIWNIAEKSTNELGLVTLYDVNDTTGNIDSIRQVIGNVDDIYNLETDDIVTEFTYYALGTPGTDPPAGLVESITDGEGRITLYEYNPRGNPTSITYASGTADEATVEIHYAGLSTVDYIDDELDRRTEFEHDDLLRLTKTILPPPDDTAPTVRPEYELLYDIHDRVITTIDALDRETSNTYDERSRIIQIDRPDHDEDTYLTTTVMTYTRMGLLTSVTDPLNRLTEYKYDDGGRQTHVIQPEVADPTTAVNEIQIIDFDSGTEGTFKLNGNSKDATIDLADTSDFQTVLDSIWGARNTSVKVTVTEATVTFLGAFASTNVAQMTISDITGTKGATPAVIEDKAGQAADMVNPVLETQYDNLGRPTKTIDALANETSIAYANFGREVTITFADPDGAGTDYKSSSIVKYFDPAGNLTKLTDANENSTEVDFDVLGREISVTTPDPDSGGPLTSSATTKSYDKAHNLIETTDSVGNTYGFYYNNRNWLTKEVHADPDGLAGPLDRPEIEYELSLAGEVTKVTDALDRVTEYKHDGLGNVIKVILPDPDGVESEYESPEIEIFFDLASRKVKLVDALENETEYDYDLLDNLVTLTEADPDGTPYGADSPVSKWRFDAAGQMIEATDAMESVTTVLYDNLGQVIKTTLADPDGKDILVSPVISNQWDLNGNLYSVTDPLYQITKNTYDAVNRRKASEDANGGLTTFTFDANSNLESLTDPENNTTTWTYDALNRVNQEKNELNFSRYFVYNQAGDVAKRTDRMGRVILFDYDNLHRKTREQWWGELGWGQAFPISLVDTEAEGAQTNEVQTVGYSTMGTFYYGTTSFTFDGQTTSSVNWNASAGDVQTALEALSNIDSGDVSVTKTSNSWSSQAWQIEFTGNLAATNVPQMTINPSLSDGAPYEVEVTDTEGGTNERQFIYLAYATGGTFTVTFDGQTTTALDWDASDGEIETALEALSNIDDVYVHWTGMNHQVYFQGSLAATDVPEMTVNGSGLTNGYLKNVLSYSYDAAGQLLSAEDEATSNEFALDELGRVLTETMTFAGYSDTITLDQVFDLAGNRSSSEWAFGTSESLLSEFGYDNLHRLTQLTRSSDEQADFWHRAQFHYNAIGQFTEINRFVGDDTTPIALADSEYLYDELHRLTSILHTTDTTTWAGYDYTYDDASRITSIDSYLDGLSEFTYDNTSQLVGADHTGSPDEDYEYDDNGNRVMAGYDIDPNNQLKSDGDYEYTYDEEGNRETRIDLANDYVTVYLWDHRNRLVGVEEYDDNEGLLSTVTNTYDAFDRWIRREVDSDGPGGTDPVDTFFAYDGLQIALEFTDDNGSAIDGDDLAHIYSWGPAIDQILADFSTTGDLNFGLSDQLGTPRDWVSYDPIGEETDPTGHQIYNAFGQETYTTGFNSFVGFTGRPYEDAIGLQNNGQRWYEAVNAMWISEDPIGFSGGDTNITRYVSNDPMQNTDPSGLDRISVQDGSVFWISESPTTGSWPLVAIQQNVGTISGDVVTLNPEWGGKTLSLATLEAMAASINSAHWMPGSSWWITSAYGTWEEDSQLIYDTINGRLSIRRGPLATIHRGEGWNTLTVIAKGNPALHLAHWMLLSPELKGYIYTEVETQDDLFALLVRHEKSLNGRRLTTLNLAGHGGALGPSASPIFDPASLTDEQVAILNRIMDPDGVIIFWGCGSVLNTQTTGDALADRIGVSIAYPTPDYSGTNFRPGFTYGPIVTSAYGWWFPPEALWRFSSPKRR